MDLSKYDNSDFNPGAGVIKRALWYIVNAIFFTGWLIPHSRIKCALLRLFGSQIGVGVNIKPRVNIKYPWNLKVGNYVWIGEGAWIDSLDKVIIGSNVCVSQEAYILTGNHDYNDFNFGLITAEVRIEDSAWVGARAVVCPGSVISSNSILTAGAVFSGETQVNGIYQGNPAIWIRGRKVQN